MIRELRFRVWDVVTRTMKYSGDFMEPIMFRPRELVAFFEYAHKGYKVIQQFTGLLDKDSREIYEGDVIQVEQRKPFVVEWHQNGSWGELNCLFCEIAIIKGINKRGHVPYRSIAYPRIIGNVYENSELLELTKEEKQSGK